MNFDLFDLLSYLADLKCPGEYDLEDEESLESFVWEYYHIDIEDFERLINDLIPLCTVGQSPLTNLWYRGFGTGSLWLLNKRIEE